MGSCARWRSRWGIPQRASWGDRGDAVAPTLGRAGPAHHGIIEAAGVPLPGQGSLEDLVRDQLGQWIISIVEPERSADVVEGGTHGLDLLGIEHLFVRFLVDPHLTLPARTYSCGSCGERQSALPPLQPIISRSPRCRGAVATFSAGESGSRAQCVPCALPPSFAEDSIAQSDRSCGSLVYNRSEERRVG